MKGSEETGLKAPLSKPYQFEICDKTFTERNTMKTHAASVHEKKKPFKCNICEFSCSGKTNLTVHVSSIQEAS